MYGMFLGLMVMMPAPASEAQSSPADGRALVENTFDPNGAYDDGDPAKDPGWTGEGEQDSNWWESTEISDDGGGLRGGAPPSNDLCSNATIIPGNTITYNPPLLNTTGATTSTCEGQQTCGAFGGNSNSVWYSYTPDFDGSINVNTYGSNYNTVLSIFSVCGVYVPPFCINPQDLVCNDDLIFGAQQSEILGFEVTAGRTYKIMVADYNSSDGGGLLDFNLQWIPANDLCSSATAITGVSYNPPPFATQNASTENCEAQESCEVNNVGTSNSVWYTYIAPCDGLISINTNGSTYDTVLSIFDGCGEFFGPDINCGVPDEIACDDDSGTGVQSQLLNIPVEGGEEYFIKVSDYNTTSGGGLLDFNFLFSGANPPSADITSPAALSCVCGNPAIVGLANAGGDPFVRWTLDYQSAGGGSWTVIASGTSAISGTLGTWDTTGLAQGYYVLRLTAENACGVSSTAVRVVFLDKQFDDLELRLPGNGAVAAGSVCIDGTAWDLCFNNYRVDYRRVGLGPFGPVNPGQPTYNTAVINDPLAPWNTVAWDVADGDYELRLQGTDGCGQAATIVHNISIDNTPPTADINSPRACEYVDGLVAVYGTADDAHLYRWTLQYTGGDESDWVTIASGGAPVIGGLLGMWDTTRLPACSYTLRLVVTGEAIVDCDDPQQSYYHVSVHAGDFCPVDFDGDGDQDLLDFARFQNCQTGP